MKNKNIIRVLEGARHLKRSKKLILIPAIYIVIVAIIWKIVRQLIPKFNFMGVSNIWLILFNVFIGEIAILGLLSVLIALGTPFEAKRIEASLVKAKFYDSDRCPPMLLSKVKDKNVIIYEFYTPILSKEDFVNKIDSFKTILKSRIEKEWIKEGKDPQHVIIETVSSKKNFQK
jgi:hypothetical protein